MKNSVAEISLKIAFIATLLVVASINVQADTLTGNGSWQSWNPTVLNTSGTLTLGVPPTSGPYWNSTSGDGTNYNIGWCLAGTGNCHISNPHGALPYYGNGTAAASNMYFTGSGSAQEVSLLGLFSSQNGVPPLGTNYFGWYSVNSNGTVGSMTQLFNSTEPVGTTATFDPTGKYGFYFENVQSPNTSFTASYYWFSNDSNDYATGTGTIDTGTQHFSIFGGPGSSTYYLGMEDTPAPNSDFDYNDMIVGLQPAPEPTNLALMAAGIGLAGLAIRRRQA